MATYTTYRALKEVDERSISPHNQMLPKFTNLHGRSKVIEIHTALYLLRRSLEYFYDTDEEEEVQHPVYGESPWLLIVRPIAHVHGGERIAWTGVFDYNMFQNFSYFWTSEVLARPVGPDKMPAKPNNAARIGLFCTKIESWVGKGSAWKKSNWHVWVAMIAHPRKGETEVWIYDCNAIVEHPGKQKVNAADLKVDMQRQFIDYCRAKRKINFTRAWIAGDPQGNDDGTCLQRTMLWLESTLQPEHWISWPWTETKSRNLGFLPLELSKAGRNKSKPSTDRYAVPKDYDPPQSRSRSRSRVSSRTSSPSVDPSRKQIRKSPRITRKPSRLAIEESVIDPVGEITVHTKDAECELDEVTLNNLLQQQLTTNFSGIDIEILNNQQTEQSVPSIENTTIAGPSITIPPPKTTGTEKESRLTPEQKLRRKIEKWKRKELRKQKRVAQKSTEPSGA